MIRDTCTCGADFDVSYRNPASERYAHGDWLKAHAVCREKWQPEPEQLVVPDDQITYYVAVDEYGPDGDLIHSFKIRDLEQTHVVGDVKIRLRRDYGFATGGIIPGPLPPKLLGELDDDRR